VSKGGKTFTGRKVLKENTEKREMLAIAGQNE
jgi:hypothetical protein